jgi:hypothetical protein
MHWKTLRIACYRARDSYTNHLPERGLARPPPRLNSRHRNLALFDLCSTRAAFATASVLPTSKLRPGRSACCLNHTSTEANRYQAPQASKSIMICRNRASKYEDHHFGACCALSTLICLPSMRGIVDPRSPFVPRPQLCEIL